MSNVLIERLAGGDWVIQVREHQREETHYYTLWPAGTGRLIRLSKNTPVGLEETDCWSRSMGPDAAQALILALGRLAQYHPHAFK